MKSEEHIRIHRNFLFSRSIEDYPGIRKHMPAVFDVLVWLKPTIATGVFYDMLRDTYWTSAVADEAQEDLQPKAL